MKATLSQKTSEHDPTALDQFAAPMGVQLWTVVVRVFQQYWRTPSYLYSKTALCVGVVCRTVSHTDLC
jgi:ATP-binding cassette subfamily G (WHITE) protein 2 (PDR)